MICWLGALPYGFYFTVQFTVGKGRGERGKGEGGGWNRSVFKSKNCGGVGLHVLGKLALMGKEHEMVLGMDTNGSFFCREE
jgi:hypothetical protein